MMRQFVLDTETTGLEPSDGHRVIQAGLVKIVDGSVASFYYHQYYNLGQPLDPQATEMVGMSDEFLTSWPSIMEEGRALLNIIDGHELITNNAPFDAGFMNNRIRLTMPGEPLMEQRCKITDTLRLARKLHPGQKCNLRALMGRHRTDMRTYEDFYKGTLYDAAALVEVYLKIEQE